MDYVPRFRSSVFKLTTVGVSNRYKQGITNKAIKVEATKPKPIALARGNYVGSLKAKGITPTIVVILVVKIGRKRSAVPLAVASRTFIYIFTKDNIEEIINIQPKNNKAKGYQVKQIRNLIVKYHY